MRYSSNTLFLPRFAPEADYGANAGLKVGRDLLEDVKKKFPWISYADLWTLAGVVAVEDMGGEKHWHNSILHQCPCHSPGTVLNVLQQGWEQHTRTCFRNRASGILRKRLFVS